MENEEDIQLFRNLLRGLVASETSKVNAFRDDSFDQVSYAAKHVIATGKQSQFIEQLTQYINLKDADIERLSNTSYQVSYHFHLSILILPFFQGIRRWNRSIIKDKTWHFKHDQRH